MNEKFEPVGLIEISRQIKSSLKKAGERRQSEQRDRELLESHGIDVEPLFANVQKIIADHETGSTTSHERDIDEDEPDQYPPEPEKWGGTK